MNVFDDTQPTIYHSEFNWVMFLWVLLYNKDGRNGII